MKQQVLFLCTGNSAQSQMAEGLLRHLVGDPNGAGSDQSTDRGSVYQVSLMICSEALFAGRDAGEQFSPL